MLVWPLPEKSRSRAGCVHERSHWSSLSIRTGGTWLRNYSRPRPTGCHSERIEESLCRGHWHMQNHGEILRFAQNDSKRDGRPQGPQWSALSSMPTLKHYKGAPSESSKSLKDWPTCSTQPSQ